MAVKTVSLRLAMQGNTQIENVTKPVAEALAGARLLAGIVTVFIKHTTASVMIIEDEPGIRADTKVFWDRAVSADPAWQHNTRNAGEDNGHSHLRGQLQGPSVTIPFLDGVLLLDGVARSGGGLSVIRRGRRVLRRVAPSRQASAGACC